MTTGIDEKILKKLETLEKQEGPLPRSLEFYGKLLAIQSATRLRTGTPPTSLSPADIDERIAAGRPLLGFADLSVDWALFYEIFKEVSDLLSGYSKEWAEAAGNLKATPMLLEKSAREWFEEGRAPFPGDSDSTEDLWNLMIQSTFKPFLKGRAEALRGHINNELWRRGYCPVCGGSPDFAFLEKEYGAKWLLCSRCDNEWLFKRLECPSCGTENQDDLAYFPDDKGLYRVYVCEQCRHYLKAIDLRQTDDDVLLPLERFFTLDLDYQAQKNGYKPPARTSGGAGIKGGR